MRSFALPALLCSLLVCGCAPATVTSLVKEQGAKQMAAREVLTLVQGHTLLLRAFNEEAQLYFEPAGHIVAKGVPGDTDKGRWDVSEAGELCLRMEKWWYGDLRCFDVYQSGDQGKVRLATGSGVLQYAVERLEGDAKGLAKGVQPRKKDLRRSITKEDRASVPPVREERRPAVPEGTVAAQEYAAKDTGATVEYLAKDCPGCNLAGADLGRADLIEANLAGADLHGANLSMANLRRADLHKADLREAVMTYANLPGADLRGADLRGARLKGANLIKADLTGAKLEGADLTEVLREGAKGF